MSTDDLNWQDIFQAMLEADGARDEMAAELNDMLFLAQQLRELGQRKMPDAEASLARTKVRVLQSIPASSPAPAAKAFGVQPFWRRWRLALAPTLAWAPTAFVIAIAITLLVGAMVFVSGNTQPGSPLYPIKQAANTVLQAIAITKEPGGQQPVVVEVATETRPVKTATPPRAETPVAPQSPKTPSGQPVLSSPAPTVAPSPERPLQTPQQPVRTVTPVATHPKQPMQPTPRPATLVAEAVSPTPKRPRKTSSPVATKGGNVTATPSPTSEVVAAGMTRTPRPALTPTIFVPIPGLPTAATATSPAPTATLTPTATEPAPTATLTATPRPFVTDTPTATPSSWPTATPTTTKPAPTATLTATPRPFVTDTPTATPTSRSTATSTATKPAPTATFTTTPRPFVTDTPTPTKVRRTPPKKTPPPTRRPTNTPVSATATATPRPTSTPGGVKAESGTTPVHGRSTATPTVRPTPTPTRQPGRNYKPIVGKIRKVRKTWVRIGRYRVFITKETKITGKLVRGHYARALVYRKNRRYYAESIVVTKSPPANRKIRTASGVIRNVGKTRSGSLGTVRIGRYTYHLDKDTVVKGEVVKGARATVRYYVENHRRYAVSIVVKGAGASPGSATPKPGRKTATPKPKRKTPTPTPKSKPKPSRTPRPTRRPVARPTATP